jgi:hypothetical protein
MAQTGLKPNTRRNAATWEHRSLIGSTAGATKKAGMLPAFFAARGA